jgi:hypothetical protein
VNRQDWKAPSTYHGIPKLGGKEFGTDPNIFTPLLVMRSRSRDMKNTLRLLCSYSISSPLFFQDTHRQSDLPRRLPSGLIQPKKTRISVLKLHPALGKKFLSSLPPSIGFFASRACSNARIPPLARIRRALALRHVN